MYFRKLDAFTLIELMIVVAIIAIIAAIAIPNLIKAKVSANEGAAVGSLDAIAKAQTTFKEAKDLDQDDDGTGEYGLLSELTGSTSARLTTAASPQPLGQLFAPTAGGSTASKGGYRFRIYVPGSDDNQLADAFYDANPPGASGGASDMTNAQENYFVVYAWPDTAGKTGNKVYVVNDSMEKYSAKMTATTYSGSSIPNANAAFAAGSDTFDDRLANGAGVDGNTWVPSGG